MLSAKGIRNIVAGVIEVMGPTPPEVTLVREKLGGYEKAKEHVRYVSDEQIDTWTAELNRKDH